MRQLICVITGKLLPSLCVPAASSHTHVAFKHTIFGESARPAGVITTISLFCFILEVADIEM